MIDLSPIPLLDAVKVNAPLRETVADGANTDENAEQVDRAGHPDRVSVGRGG